MKHKKKLEGLEARRRDYEKMISHMTGPLEPLRKGFTEPGSIKKSHGKIEKRR